MAYSNHYTVRFCGNGYLLTGENPCLGEYTSGKTFDSMSEVNSFLAGEHKGRRVPVIHMSSYSPAYLKAKVSKIVNGLGRNYIGG